MTKFWCSCPAKATQRAPKRSSRRVGKLRLQRGADERTYTSEAEALSSHGGVLPAGTMLVPGRAESATPNAPAGTVWYVLDRVPIVTGQDLRNATTSPNAERPGSYQVNFNLSTAAAARFGPFTEQQSQLPVKGRMAIVLDRQVYCAPELESRIDE